MSHFAVWMLSIFISVFFSFFIAQFVSWFVGDCVFGKNAHLSLFLFAWLSRTRCPPSDCWVGQENRPTVIFLELCHPSKISEKDRESKQNCPSLGCFIRPHHIASHDGIYIRMSWAKRLVGCSFQSIRMKLFIFQRFLCWSFFPKKCIHISPSLIYNDCAHYWLFRWNYSVCWPNKSSYSLSICASLVNERKIKRQIHFHCSIISPVYFGILASRVFFCIFWLRYIAADL